MKSFIRLPGRRKRWAVSQRELAQLLGVHPATVSKFENGRLEPGARTMLALEVVFGRCAKFLFPSAHKQVEEEVMRRAATLDRALRGKKDHASIRKRVLLSRMAGRGQSPPRP